MLMVDHLMHTDLHPGNIIVEPNAPRWCSSMPVRRDSPSSHALKPTRTICVTYLPCWPVALRVGRDGGG